MIDHILPDPAALARAAATWLAETLAATEGTPSVALSGGSTPKAMYELLATKPLVGRVPWRRVHWFWGDERFVPHGDDRSNYHMTLEAMLRHVPVPPDHIHPIVTEGVSPAQSARRYQAALQAFHGDNELDKAPLFDVVLLGLGTNGHTASLFPNTPSLGETRAWAVPVTPEGEPTRITLTFPALESCRHAAFVVSGAAKKEVVSLVREGEPSLPAARYHPHGELHWFMDKDAAP